MSLLRKKQENAELAGANGDSISHVSSSTGTRDESKRPPSSNQENFLLSDLLLVSPTVAPDVLITPATHPPLFPLAEIQDGEGWMLQWR